MTSTPHVVEDLALLPVPVRRAVKTYLARHTREYAQEHAPVTVAWASGRVNLIGEHTDYNDGYVLPVAIDRVIALAGRPNSSAHARIYSRHHDQSSEFALPTRGLSPKSRGHLWIKYVRGVLAQLADVAEPAIPGFDAVIVGDVPVGGGMSSSAALEVATATFAAALGGPDLSPLETARLCQRAEQESAGVRVGIMDQATSCLGRAGHAILLDCRSLGHEYVPINLPDIALAVYDTAVTRSLAGSEYNVRREQCEQAAERLGQLMRRDDPPHAVSSLRDVTDADLKRYGSHLPDILRRRVRHVVSENARVLAAVEALRGGDAHALGALLYASHDSLRDDYEVSCAELDAVVDIARRVPGVLGARMMGAGFGGSALVLVRQDTLPALEAALRDEYPKRTGRSGTLHVCNVSGGPQHGTIAPRAAGR